MVSRPEENTAVLRIFDNDQPWSIALVAEPRSNKRENVGLWLVASWYLDDFRDALICLNKPILGAYVDPEHPLIGMFLSLTMREFN